MAKALYPACIEDLITSFRNLPGIGKRTAERLALSVSAWECEEVTLFASRLQNLVDELKFCKECGNFSETDVCSICEDRVRRSNVICIVEQPAQVSAIEQSGIFRGLYHVLGGKLAPLDGIGPDQLNIDSLVSRVRKNPPEEIIIALSYDVEGEATASFLVEELRGCDVKVTRPATGIPLGTDITVADAGTLSAALNRRYTL